MNKQGSVRQLGSLNLCSIDQSARQQGQGKTKTRKQRSLGRREDALTQPWPAQHRGPGNLRAEANRKFRQQVAQFGLGKPSKKCNSRRKRRRKREYRSQPVVVI